MVAENAGNGGAGFNGCLRNPAVAGGPGGRGGSLTTHGTLVRTMDSFNGGRGGDGNPAGGGGSGGGTDAAPGSFEAELVVNSFAPGQAGEDCGLPIGSGRLERDCSGDPDCAYLNAFVKSTQRLSGVSLEPPAGYSVGGAGGAYVGANQIGSCSHTGAGGKRLNCTFTEQAAGTEIRLVWVTNDEVGSMPRRLPDGAGSDLYLVSPRAAGPFGLTGP